MRKGRRPNVNVQRIGVCAGLLVVLLLGKCEITKPNLQAPLFDNLGKYRWEITTSSRYAQRFFTQGIVMASGFNHAEAARSMREVIRLDSACAMGYWGLAYVLGPSYNTQMQNENYREVNWAVQRAKLYARTTSKWEKALIDANEAKYKASEPDEVAYTHELRLAVMEFPSIPELKVLLAESLMNQHAWDLYEWRGGPPKTWTSEIVGLLSDALEADPDNPLANHLFIHAVEASEEPEVAMPSAKRLATSVPGAGHLVHMPSHIYINTGDYHSGTLANVASVRADSIYLAQNKKRGTYGQLYYPHNYHFLAACAALEGRGALAIEASFKMTNIIEEAFLGKPGFETTDYYLTIPYNILVKFAQWEKILSLNTPDENSHPYRWTMWHYARGMASANMGQLLKSKSHLEKLKEYSKDDRLHKLRIWDINPATQLAEIAGRVLESEIAWRCKKPVRAEELLLEAISLEDRLRYDEPPDWIFSVRHRLGALLLEMDRPEEAQTIYEEDLVNFPKNGFALNGLWQCLHKQGKLSEAEKIKKEFDRVWAYADTPLRYSRVDPRYRKNLQIQVGYDTPNELVYIASASCGFN